MPLSRMPRPFAYFFFFNDTATTEIYTLSLHDALPICRPREPRAARTCSPTGPTTSSSAPAARCRSDRKSTRLNSSHGYISYAVFCLKKKKKKHSESLHVRDQRNTHPTSAHQQPSPTAS